MTVVTATFVCIKFRQQLTTFLFYSFGATVTQVQSDWCSAGTSFVKMENCSQQAKSVAEMRTLPKQPTTPTEKVRSEMRSEKKPSASPTKRHLTADEPEPLPPDFRSWTSAADEPAPDEVSTERQMAVSSGPKRKNGRKRKAMQNTGPQSATQSAGMQQKTTEPLQADNTVTELSERISSLKVKDKACGGTDNPTSQLVGLPQNKYPLGKNKSKSKKMKRKQAASSEQQTSSSDKNREVKQQHRGDTEKPTTPTEKVRSETRSEKKPSASLPERLATEEKPESLPPDFRSWTSVAEEGAPEEVYAEKQTTVPLGPKKNNGKRRKVMKNTVTQPTTQSATEVQPQISAGMQRDTTEPLQMTTEMFQILSWLAFVVSVPSYLSFLSVLAHLSSTDLYESDVTTGTSQSSSGEMEKLFFDELEKGFPDHFFPKKLRVKRKSGRMVTVNPHELCIDRQSTLRAPMMFCGTASNNEVDIWRSVCTYWHPIQTVILDMYMFQM